MTIEEQLARNHQVTHFIGRIALPLGIWFIVEYLITVYATRNLALAMIHTPLMMLTPIALFCILRKIRNTYYTKDGFPKRVCWYLTTLLMFLAGLFEAVFVIIYNKWISPNNLMEMRESMLAQAQQLTEAIHNTGQASTFSASLLQGMNLSIETIKNAPIDTPMGAAFNLLSNDIAYGMIISLIIGIILYKKNPKA